MNAKSKMLLWLLFSAVSVTAYSQSIISGSIKTSGGQPVPGASIYLVNTFDGTSAGADGGFTLATRETGEKMLAVSAMGFTTQQKSVTLNGQPVRADFTLQEEVAELNAVVISAGAFEANNDREVAVLKPMDIYNNAGAAGDIVGAIQTLPGTQRVAEQTGLFVRGGDATESAVIIDGMVVQNAFFSNVPGVAQRSRFTPFQFKGMAFSSGGYSVRYGQALSSILELNTLDLPEKSTLSANLNMAGLALAGARRWQASAAEATAYYTNLAPFYNVANTNFDFYDVPSGGGASAKWSAQNKQGGIFKVFAKHDRYQSGTAIPDPYNTSSTVRFGLENINTYFNGSFRKLKDKYLLYSALSFSDNVDKTTWGPVATQNKDWRLQGRMEATYFASGAFNITVGAELNRYAYDQNLDSAQYQFDETLAAAYLETEWKPGKRFALKPGFRFEHSAILGRTNLAPRAALAFLTGTYSQVSVAAGYFYQLADKRYLLAGSRPGFQQAVHAIANYQWIKDSRSFRVEGYYKSYEALVRERNSTYNPNPYRLVSADTDNKGNGYAQGIDIFWRDQKTIAGFDYWIGYSFIDTERLYANLPEKATPDFVSQNNVNVNAKYFIESLQLSAGFTYSYASGRPYFNPSDTHFLESRSAPYHNLSLNMAYLTTADRWFCVFYAGIDNAINHKNILGYRYTADGQTRYAITPPLYRSVFVGVNISLTAFKKEEL